MATTISQLERVLLLLSFYQCIIRAQTVRAASNYTDHMFICNAANPCSANATIYCPTNADCSLLCHTIASCEDATVHCPVIGSCDITCNQAYACKNAQFLWTENQPNSLFCGLYEESCYGVSFIASSLPPRSSLSAVSNNTDYVLLCTSESECSRTIFCPTDADCNISCNAYASCQEAIIYCPSNGACHISCNMDSACDGALIHWVDNQPNSLFCGVYDYACKGIDFKPYNQTTDFSQNCTASGMCSGATFYCPSNANCSIKCDGDRACYASTIYCPTNHGSCNVICTDDLWTFMFSRIYAQNALFLNFAVIHTAGSFSSIQDISIWFPPKAGNIPRARLDLDTTSNNNGGQNYYALNGWQDVDVYISGYNYNEHSGIMHCNTGYIDSCAFASDSFSCNSSNPICDDPIISTAVPVAATSLPSGTMREGITNVETTELLNAFDTSNVKTVKKKKNETMYLLIGILSGISFTICCNCFIYLVRKKSCVKELSNNNNNEQCGEDSKTEDEFLGISEHMHMVEDNHIEIDSPQRNQSVSMISQRMTSEGSDHEEKQNATEQIKTADIFGGSSENEQIPGLIIKQHESYSEIGDSLADINVNEEDASVLKRVKTPLSDDEFEIVNDDEGSNTVINVALLMSGSAFITAGKPQLKSMKEDCEDDSVESDEIWENPSNTAETTKQ